MQAFPASEAVFLSVVIPVFNEAESVIALHTELVQALKTLDRNYEIVFVDDGSTDQTFEHLVGLKPVRVVRLRRNVGQTAAFDAGFRHARGEVIVTMDGDGQNPPFEIPRLLAKLEAGPYDVVSGWRKERHDAFAKRFISKGAHVLRRLLLHDTIHDAGCSLKAYRRICFEDLQLMGEMHRFIPELLAWQGFRVAELAVAHRPRMHGRTKYNWHRTVKGLIDMGSILFWRKYANRPLHLFGGLGILMLALGSSTLFALLIRKYIYDVPLAQSSLPLLAATALVLGLQFFIGGIIADIAIKSHYKNRPISSVRELVETRVEPVRREDVPSSVHSPVRVALVSPVSPTSREKMPA